MAFERFTRQHWLPLLTFLSLILAACTQSLSFPQVSSTPTPPPTPTATYTPTATPIPSPTATPTAAELAERSQLEREQRALVRAQGVRPVSLESLWDGLAGFSGKSNQEREAYIAEQLFPRAGLTPIEKQPVPYSGPWGPEYGSWEGLSNIIVLRQGSLPEGVRGRIILGAHFDKITYPGRSPNPGRSDGILDNASGVNLMAKIMEALGQPRNDIQVVAFATEEPPPFFNGSRLFFASLPGEDMPLFYVNFDVLGRDEMALVRGSAEEELAAIAEKVAAEVGIPLAWREASSETSSDQLMAQAKGLRVMALTSTGFAAKDIHVPEDNLGAMDRQTYYEHYLLALRLIAYLDGYFGG